MADERLVEQRSVSTPHHSTLSTFCLSWEFMSQTHPESCNPSKSICYCSAPSHPMSVPSER